MDGITGTLEVRLDAAEFAAREPARWDLQPNVGTGRELFAFMRESFSSAEEGASAFTRNLASLT
ncbi:Phosphogluconate dehydratase [compost metagenome]